MNEEPELEWRESAGEALSGFEDQHVLEVGVFNYHYDYGSAGSLFSRGRG